MNTGNLKNLPNSDDAYWDGAIKESVRPIPISICGTHKKDNWMEHNGYVDNHDGTISCKFCPWGCYLAGFLRVKDERILDLRELNRG